MRTQADDILEAQELCKQLALPGERMKAVYTRIAKSGGVSWETAKKYWGGKKQIVPGYVLHNLKQAVEAHERETQRRFFERKARRDRFYFLTHEAPDAEFHSARVDEAIGPTLEGD